MTITIIFESRKNLPHYGGDLEPAAVATVLIDGQPAPEMSKLEVFTKLHIYPDKVCCDYNWTFPSLPISIRDWMRSDDRKAGDVLDVDAATCAALQSELTALSTRIAREDAAFAAYMGSY